VTTADKSPLPPLSKGGSFFIICLPASAGHRSAQHNGTKRRPSSCPTHRRIHRESSTEADIPALLRKANRVLIDQGGTFRSAASAHAPSSSPTGDGDGETTMRSCTIALRSERVATTRSSARCATRCSRWSRRISLRCMPDATRALDGARGVQRGRHVQAQQRTREVQEGGLCECVRD